MKNKIHASARFVAEELKKSVSEQFIELKQKTSAEKLEELAAEVARKRKIQAVSIVSLTMQTVN